MKHLAIGWAVCALMAWPLAADAAAAASQGTITVPEAGSLNGLAARVLNEGNQIKVAPGIAVSLGLVEKAETTYVAYDKNLKDHNALQDIRVSQQRGKTDIVFGAMDPVTKMVMLYLTSPSGILEKALASGKSGYADVALDQAQPGFQQAVDFWLKALPPTKTGSFETTFTARSPFSEMKALARRLAFAGETTDYDLGNETFLVYVPEKYNLKMPMGLLVLANYKPTDSLPEPVLPQLADANMAMIVAKDFPQDAWWQRAGFALDAAYNMQQLYKIDPRRIYIFGGGDWPSNGKYSAMVSERLGLNFPEVFTGTFTSNLYGYDQVPDGRGGLWMPLISKPGPRALSLAKGRPLVVGDEGADNSNASFAAAMTQEGFKYLKLVTITKDQFHYPNYTTDWLPDVLKYMDATTANLDLSQMDEDGLSATGGP